MDEVELRRILWRSRRGLLELDLQLERFVADVLPTLSDAELTLYGDVLLLPDQDFLAYVNGVSACPDARLEPMIERIRSAQR